ncbi:MAG: hypothetical protein ACFE7R_03065, partial [Candidatus Hodarchaeota archaeon]
MNRIADNISEPALGKKRDQSSLKRIVTSESVIQGVIWVMSILAPYAVLNPGRAMSQMIAPTWVLNYYQDSSSYSFFEPFELGYVLIFQIRTYLGHTTLGVTSFGLSYMLLSLPIVLGVLVLEAIHRNRVKAVYAQPFAIWYPLILVGVSGLVGYLNMTIGGGASFIPLPVASLVQFLRYRQLSQRKAPGEL